MKSKFLLPLTLLAGMTLVACADKVTYSVEIANKAALQAEWHVKESARDLDIKLTPEGNVNQLIRDKELTITSSNPDVVSVTGIAVNALKAGTSTVEVAYKGVKDSVALTVQEEKGEPGHVSATVSQIIANLADGKEKDVIYDIDAYIVAWQDGKTDATKYGNYMIADAKGETDASKQILVYGSSANLDAFTIAWDGEAYGYTQGDDAKDFLTNEKTKDCAIGSKLTMSVIAYKYNGTKNEVSGYITAVDNSGAEHHDYPEPSVKQSTLAEFIADKQGNGAQEFEFEGTVKAWNGGKEEVKVKDKYGNLILADGDDELIVYGCTATESALTWSKDAGKYSFNNPNDFLDNKFTNAIEIGDKLKVRLIRADYTDKDGNVTIEGTGVVLEVNGKGPAAPSDGWKKVTAAPVAGTEYKLALDRENNSSNPGYWYLKDELESEAKESGKNYYITTDSSADKGAVVDVVNVDGKYHVKVGARFLSLVQAESSGKTFVNAGLVRTEEEATLLDFDVAKGFGFTFGTGDDAKFYGFGTRNDKGYTTVGSTDLTTYPDNYKVFLMEKDGSDPSGGGDDPSPSDPTDPIASAIKLDFADVAKGSELKEGTLEAMKTAAGSDASHIKGANSSKVYAGNATGGAYENQGGFLKFGTSSVEGELKIQFDGLVNKVEINCHDFYKPSEKYPTNTNTVAVNEGTPVLAPYNSEASGEVLTFSLEKGASVISIKTHFRIFCFSITVSYVGK